MERTAPTKRVCDVEADDRSPSTRGSVTAAVGSNEGTGDAFRSIIAHSWLVLSSPPCLNGMLRFAWSPAKQKALGFTKVMRSRYRTPARRRPVTTWRAMTSSALVARHECSAQSAFTGTPFYDRSRLADRDKLRSANAMTSINCSSARSNRGSPEDLSTTSFANSDAR